MCEKELTWRVKIEREVTPKRVSKKRKRKKKGERNEERDRENV
jgi:hypothetical protein